MGRVGCAEAEVARGLINGEVMCRKASSIITAMLQRVKRQTLYTKKSGCQGPTTQNARSATSYLLISLNDKKPQSGANFQTRRQRDMIQDQTIGVISSNSS